MASVHIKDQEIVKRTLTGGKLAFATAANLPPCNGPRGGYHLQPQDQDEGASNKPMKIRKKKT